MFPRIVPSREPDERDAAGYQEWMLQTRDRPASLADSQALWQAWVARPYSVREHYRRVADTKAAA